MNTEAEGSDLTLERITVSLGFIELGDLNVEILCTLFALFSYNLECQQNLWTILM